MSEIFNLSRREFCKSGVVLGGGLVLGFYVPDSLRAAENTAGPAEVFLNAFIRISSDETVTIIVNKSEMGQGVYTSLPMLIAEELEVDWASIRFEPAPVDPAYNHTQFGPIQVTGGSTSIRSCWDQFRTAGATARMMLEQAAAETWKVPPEQCRAENGFVVEKSSGQKLSFGKLVKKAAQQTAPATVTLKNPDQFKVLGKPKKRLDTPEKVNAKAIFGIDVAMPGMVIAVVARSPVFGGKVKSYDDKQAKAIPGVINVVQIDSGIAVVADHFWPARLGREALKIEWDEGPLATLDSKRQSQEYAAMAAKPGLIAAQRGDAVTALATATQKIEAVYEGPYLAHAPMEPLNCYADVRPDSCEIRVGTQMQTAGRDLAASLTGLPKEKVKLHTTYLGGGFGRRAVLDSHFVGEAVQLSMAVKKPVKVIWTREDDIHGWYYRPSSYQTISAGLADDGMPTALKQRIVSQSIAKGTPFEGVMIKDGIDDTSVEGAYDSPYDIPNLLVESHMAPQGVPVLWWRSVGHSFNGFVKEGFIDELAHLAGKDPYQYRRQLLSKHPRQQALLDLVAKKANWGTPSVAGRSQGIAIHESFGSIVAQVAQVSVAPDGKIRVHKVVCGIDCGMTVNPDTIKAQMESAIVFGLSAALYGAITFEKGRVVQSNFHDYPMLRMDEMPLIEVHIMPSLEKVGGAGEPGVPPIAPAVANAVFAAKGIRLRSLPMTKSLVYQMLQAV